VRVATVLVAEDDPAILDLLVFTLRGSGHEVLTRTDGKAALEAATTEHPDLVVLDVAMPGATGLDVCRELRSNASTARLPVIMLTARARWLDVSVGFEAGADDYLVKPFSPDELLRRIDTLLAH
jgi:two-component system, OmpR family, phosphate regulon response regulator PhoB